MCVTGFFDPFRLEWLDWMIDMLGIPKTMLPEIRDTAGDWGKIHADIFGAEIAIRCVISDQGASLFGSFCFECGDVRLSMGTGSFLSMNTGRNPHCSVSGNAIVMHLFDIFIKVT